MRLVNDKVQLALILPHRVGQRFPDGILSFVRFMRQQLITAELLCIQKVDIAALQGFAVENGVDGMNVADTDFIGFAFDFAAGLLVEFGHIGQPYNNSVGIALCFSRTEKYVLKKRGHHNGLTRSCGGRERNDNLFFCVRQEHTVRTVDAFMEIRECVLLKSK